ncbi:hypothetical protein HN358_00410 [Candidatus Uhrbacteria bacterium]|jgi:hypothetical protein|nr:hypothetical protein [Candidatus Uhrbacteria bacterium]MBT7717696.1 hypothetical protein [Candidatus Uhrbacteria bacterium]
MPEQIPEQPQVQPEPHVGHRSPIVWIVISIVLLVVIAVSAIAGFLYWPESAAEVGSTEVGMIDDQECNEVCNTPFFFTDTIENGQTSLWMVDRCSNEESLVISYQQVPVQLVAAPQLNYDGRIFYSSITGIDDIGYSVSVLDVATKTSEKASFNDLLPANGDAREVSDDQTKMAVLYDNSVAGDDLRAAGVIDLLTGERTMVGELGDGQYYSQYQSDDTLYGAYGYTIQWLSDECFQAAVYEEPGDNFHSSSSDQKQLVNYERYCIE